MASANINTKTAVQQINALINEFNKLQASINGTGEVSAANFRKVETGLKGLTTVAKQTVTEFQKLEKQYKNMSKSQKSFVTQTRNLKTALAQVTAENKKLQTSMKKTNTGMTGFGKTMLGIASGLGLVSVADNFLKLSGIVIDTIRSLDALGYSMRATIKDTYELAQSTGWLQDISQKFGAELITTTNRYIKFRSAARSAGFTAKETQDIFETMTEASGTLGLKTDELRGIYLALEQMISKGKITTEELRRQLGERLPGAMDIMAKSMKISTRELDEMLKKGNVITKEVLPAFAEEVRNTFGLTGEDIDTVNASVSRFSTSWQLLIMTIDEGKGPISSALKGFYDGLTDIFNGFTDVATVMNYGGSSFADKARALFTFEDAKLLADQIKAKKELAMVDREMIKLTAELAEEQGIEYDIGQLGIAMMNMTIEQKKEYINLLKQQRQAQEDANEMTEGTVEWLRAQIKANNEIIEGLGRPDLVRIRNLQTINKEHQKELDFLLAKVKAGRGGSSKIDTSAEDLEIGRLQRIRKQQEDNSDLEKFTEEERIAFLEESVNTEIKLAQAVANKKILLARGNADIITNIEEQLVSDIRDIQDKGAEDVASLQVQMIRDGAAKRAEAVEKEMNDEINRLTDHARHKSILYKDTGALAVFEQEELNAEIEQVQLDFHNRALQEQIDFMKKWVLTMALTPEDRAKIEASISELEKGIKNSVTDLGDGVKDNFTEIMEKVAEFVDGIAELGDAIFARKIENINAEIEAEEDKYARLIELAEDDAAQKERLEYEKEAVMARLEAKRLKEEQKQAKFNKAMAITQIAISTAIGIAQANGKGIFGWWEIPIIAALGALQMATVIAQPIPQYKDGLKNAKSDHIGKINDGGVREYVERDGQILSTGTKDAIVQLKKGDTVHKDFDSMVKNAMLINAFSNGAQIGPGQYDELSTVLETGIERGFRKAKIKNTVNLNGYNPGREMYKKSLNW